MRSLKLEINVTDSTRMGSNSYHKTYIFNPLLVRHHLSETKKNYNINEQKTNTRHHKFLILN